MYREMLDSLGNVHYQFLGGYCNDKQLYGFIYLNKRDSNDFVLCIDTGGVKNRDNLNGNQVLINPSRKVFTDFLLYDLNGLNNTEVFYSFYFGLLTQTTKLQIPTEKKAIQAHLMLSGLRLDDNGIKIINDIIRERLIKEQREDICNDIYDTICFITENSDIASLVW